MPSNDLAIPAEVLSLYFCDLHLNLQSLNYILKSYHFRPQSGHLQFLAFLCETISFEGFEGKVVLDALLQAYLPPCFRAPVLLLGGIVLVKGLNFGKFIQILLLVGTRVTSNIFIIRLGLSSLLFLKGGFEFFYFFLLGDDELLFDGEQMPKALEFMQGKFLSSRS